MCIGPESCEITRSESAEHRAKLAQRRAPNQIHHRRRGRPDYLVGERPIIRSPEHDAGRIALRVQAVDQPGQTVDPPALGLPTAPAIRAVKFASGRPAAAVSSAPAAASSSAQPQRKRRRLNVQAEGPRHAQVLRHGVAVRCHAADTLGVEHPGELSRVGEPDSPRRTARPRQEPAAHQTLEIDHQVELSAAQTRHEPQKIKQNPRTLQHPPVPPAIKRDNLIQQRVPLQKGRNALPTNQAICAAG